MPSGGDILSLLQIPFGLLSMGQQNQLQNRYTADVDQQIADLLSGASKYGPEVLNTYDSSANPALQELLGLRPRQMTRAGQLVNAWEDRYRKGKEDIEGYGKQQSEDIDESFDNDLAGTLSGLQERGIASTTAVGSQKNLNTVQRSKEKRRLGEDVQRLRMSFLPGLEGDAINARTNVNDLDRLLTGGIADWYGGNAANRSNIVGSGIDRWLQAIQGIQRVPPQGNPYPGAIGANLAGTPDYSKGNLFG